MLARTVAELVREGLEPRHLRQFRTAADREASLVAQLVSAQARQKDPDARERAESDAAQLAAVLMRLHALLVKSAPAPRARPLSPVRSTGARSGPARVAGRRRVPGCVGTTIAARAGTRCGPTCSVRTGAERHTEMIEMRIVGVRVEMPSQQPILMLAEELRTAQSAHPHRLGRGHRHRHAPAGSAPGPSAHPRPARCGDHRPRPIRSPRCGWSTSARAPSTASWSSTTAPRCPPGRPTRSPWPSASRCRCSWPTRSSTRPAVVVPEDEEASARKADGEEIADDEVERFREFLDSVSPRGLRRREGLTTGAVAEASPLSSG